MPRLKVSPNSNVYRIAQVAQLGGIVVNHYWLTKGQADLLAVRVVARLSAAPALRVAQREGISLSDG